MGTIKSAGSGAPPIKVQEQFDLFQKESVTAVTSLAMASSTATEFGHTRVSEAVERVQFAFMKVYEVSSAAAIPPATITALQQRVDVLESEVKALQRERADAPMTKAFRCHKDFEACKARASAADKSHHWSCWLAYLTCLGQHVTKAVSKSD